MSSTVKHRNQAGMVSFMVTLIMMMVITLIVLGFSEVTRRTQRESLDRQLSAQAFYAAESGINVTASTINDYVQANGADTLHKKTSCANDYDPADANGNGTPIDTLSPDNGVAYTCVLVNPTPQDIYYDVSQSGSSIAHIGANSGNFRSLTVKWHKQSGSAANWDSNCSSGSSFPPLANWQCGYGVVRIELLAAPNGNNLSNTNLDSNTNVIYLTPLGSHSGAVTVAPGGGQVYVASGQGCDTTGTRDGDTCQVTITLPGGGNNYYARLTSIYRDAKGTDISGLYTNGTPIAFVNSQVIIDVTGKSQDELRRISTRLQLTGMADGGTLPLNALASPNDICKHFSIQTAAPDNTVDPTDLCQ